MQLPIISDPEKPSLRAGDKQSEGQRGRYAVVSLGCPKNLVDTEQMLGRLDEDGYQMTDTVDDADFVVVNTCGFIDSAREESLGAIDEMLALKREGKIQNVVVTGCLAERQQGKLLEARPEIDAMVASKNDAAATRANGGTAMMDAAHQKRFNVKYLAWIDSGVGFNIFTVNEPKFRSSDGVLDLGGVKIRDNPIYTAFLKSLEATTSPMPSTEAYGALEKGVIDAVPWTSIGITDLKWDKFVKYMVQPSFYSTDLGIIVNLDRWNAMSPEAKKVLQDVAIEWEVKSAADRAADTADYMKAYADGGMKFVSHSASGEANYLALAYDSVWARLTGRMEEKGSSGDVAKLRALYAPD